MSTSSVQLYTNIQASSWSVKLGTIGQVVTDVDDIAQCILIICTTPKGSLPMRLEFGTDAYDYLDQPINEAAPHLIRSTYEAVTAFEPRAVIESVVPILDGDSGLILTITWHPANAPNQTRTTTVSL